MKGLFEKIYQLTGIFLSGAGLSLASLVFYFVYGFFNSFTAEQWSFWFWVALLWPFVFIVIVVAVTLVKSSKQEDVPQYQLTEEQRQEIEEYNQKINQ